MKEINIYKHHFLVIFTTVKKPLVIVPAMGLITFSDFGLGIILLISLMAADFFTGVLASWNLWKNSKIESNFWKYGFSSARIRMSLVKSVTYFLFIICSYGIETIFKIKSFGSNSYTNHENHEITLTLFTIAISCAIEFYSIFFENLPKAGFDIEAKVSAIFLKIKNMIKWVKNINNDHNSPA
jgi:hypothetical protein